MFFIENITVVSDALVSELVERGGGRPWIEVDAPTLERFITDHVLPRSTVAYPSIHGA